MLRRIKYVIRCFGAAGDLDLGGRFFWQLPFHANRRGFNKATIASQMKTESSFPDRHVLTIDSTTTASTLRKRSSYIIWNCVDVYSRLRES